MSDGEVSGMGGGAIQFTSQALKEFKGFNTEFLAFIQAANCNTSVNNDDAYTRNVGQLEDLITANYDENKLAEYDANLAARRDEMKAKSPYMEMDDSEFNFWLARWKFRRLVRTVTQSHPEEAMGEI